MDGHIVFFTDLTALAGNTDLVTVAHANVKDRVVIVDKESVLRPRVEWKGRRVTLGKSHNVIHARIGSGITTGTLSNVGRRDQVG